MLARILLGFSFVFSLYYIIELDRFCVGHKCLEQSGLQALFDTGSSFTFLPQDIYKRVSLEVPFVNFKLQIDPFMCQLISDLLLFL